MRTENNDLKMKMSKIVKDLDKSKVALEKSSQENKQTCSSADHTLSKISDRLDEEINLNNELNLKLKHASAVF